MNTSTTGNQTAVSVDANASGDYVAVWQSPHMENNANHDVFLQPYNAEGSPLGYEQRVNPDWHGDQTNPDVAVADDGTFVVIWSTSNSQDDPAVAIAADGDFLIAFEHRDREIYGQLYGQGLAQPDLGCR